MDNYKKIFMNKKQIIINNFIGGVAWGFGATIGLALVLALLGFLVGRVDLVPIVGDFFANILEYAQKSPRLVK